MVAYGAALNRALSSSGDLWGRVSSDGARAHRETLNYLEPGIAIFDARLELIFANQRFLELRDIPGELGRVGTAFEAQVRFRAERGDYGIGDVDEIVKDRVALARRFEPHCIERTHADGSVLEIRGTPLPGGGFIAIHTNITARKKAEQELAFNVSLFELAKEKFELQAADMARMAEELSEQKERAEFADRTKSEFLAAASHELRTPLNAIMGFSRVIRSFTLGDLDVDQTLQYVEHIYEASSYLLELINNVLDISKIESDRDALLAESIDVRALVGSVVRMSHERAESAGLRLTVEFDHVQPRLFADPGKIKQVLINIVFNAIKFTPRGGRVSLRAWARRDSGYVFQISDTGIGIAIEDVPKALSLFGQIDSEQARDQKGTGLGLSLSKKLVEMHSGSLDLQSEIGVGTTVSVRLPPGRILPEDGNVQA